MVVDVHFYNIHVKENLLIKGLWRIEDWAKNSSISFIILPSNKPIISVCIGGLSRIRGSSLHVFKNIFFFFIVILFYRRYVKLGDILLTAMRDEKNHN